MSGNGGRKCSGMMLTVSVTTVASICGEKKGVCRHVSTSTLKSAMELRKIV